MGFRVHSCIKIVAEEQESEQVGVNLAKILDMCIQTKKPDKLHQLSPCPMCGGHRVVCPCYSVRCGDANYLVTKIRRPDNRETVTVVAWACTECGYLEMHAQNPRLLR